MEYFKPKSPAKPKFGKNTGDNAPATLKDLNLLVDAINNIPPPTPPLPYKKYVALAAAAGENNPDVYAVLENDSGVTFTWVRDQQGRYLIIPSDPSVMALFHVACFTNMLYNTATDGHIMIMPDEGNARIIMVCVTTGPAFSYVDGFGEMCIEIRMYPVIP